MAVKIAALLTLQAVAGIVVAGEIDRATAIEGNHHHFRVPSSLAIKPREETCGLDFTRFSEQRSPGHFETLTIESVDGRPNILSFHRSTNNGRSGSGVKYFVQFQKSDDGVVCAVDALPIARLEYQQGLIGRFPIPTLDIDSVLGEPFLIYRGTLETGGTPETLVNGLERRPDLGEGWYRIKSGSVLAPISIECAKVGKGSRCDYEATLLGSKASDGLDFGLAISNLQNAVASQANSASKYSSIAAPKKTQQGARLCRRQNGAVVIGFTEALAPDSGKVQIRIVSVGGAAVQNQIIWDYPDQWNLCE